MKTALRGALLALFFLAGGAGAQSNVLATLPAGFGEAQALEAARQVLAARGWTVRGEGNTLEAGKSISELRVFVRANTIRFTDLSERPRGERNRQFRESGPPLAAVPQAEVDALRAELKNALAGTPPPVAGKLGPRRRQGEVLVRVAPGVEPARVMDRVRLALVSRGWKVLPDEDAAVVAQNRSGETDARIRIFLADDELRFVDDSTRRGVEKGHVPERWIGYLRADLDKSLRDLPRSGASAKADTAERLRRLQGLLDSGAITPEEYMKKRAEILKDL